MAELAPRRRGPGAVAVREMRRDDALAVARLLTSVFAAPDATPGGSSRLRRTPIGADVVASWWRRCAGAWAVEAPGVGVVGAVFAAVTTEAGWFAGLAVDSAFRGLGLGAALTDQALAHFHDVGCSLVGVEVAPHATDALVMYARRGLAPVDVTLRLQIPTHALAASDQARSFRRLPIGGDDERTSDAEAVAAAEHLAAVPVSPQAFVLADFAAACAVVLCEPAPVAPPDGGALLVGPARVWSAQPARGLMLALEAAAAHARDLGRRFLEIDMPLGDGSLVPRLRRAGFTPIAGMLRLAHPTAVYHARDARTILAGRWSL